jgi:hypothetical protein
MDNLGPACNAHHPAPGYLDTKLYLCILFKIDVHQMRHEAPLRPRGDCFQDKGLGLPARRQSPAWKIQGGVFPQARENEVLLSTETEFGVRYVIDGWVVSPTAAQAEIRTVWFVHPGEEIPRFVTAHPARRRR